MTLVALPECEMVALPPAPPTPCSWCLRLDICLLYTLGPPLAPPLLLESSYCTVYLRTLLLTVPDIRRCDIYPLLEYWWWF